MQGLLNTVSSLIRLLSVGVLVLGLSGVAFGQGVQDPPPTGPVDDLQTTLQTILDQIGPCNIPPVWGKKFPGNERFVPVLDGEAYCDRETGLVWTALGGDLNGDQVVNDDDKVRWYSAIGECARLEVDGRKGWHLPLKEQLATLVDENSALCTGGGPCLPDGHPFQQVRSALYWSATTLASIPAAAWIMSFINGDVDTFSKALGTHHAWCVRGGQAFDGNTHTTLH